MLLGEIINLGNALLPTDISYQLQALPSLVAMSLDATISAEQRSRARQAVSNLDDLSRSREKVATQGNEVCDSTKTTVSIVHVNKSPCII